MIEFVDHIAIAVHDIDASLPYYRDELCLPLIHDERLPAVGVRLTYLQVGNTMVQLVQPLGEGAIAQFLAARGEGLHHICFAVHDIPEALNRLTGEAGARVFMGGRERRCAFLLNQPNGLITELTETRSYAARVDARLMERIAE